MFYREYFVVIWHEQLMILLTWLEKHLKNRQALSMSCYSGTHDCLASEQEIISCACNLNNM